MQLRVSLAVLAVALANVLFGLDWRAAPEAPPLTASASMQPVAFPEQPAWPIEPVKPESADASAGKSASEARAQAAPPGCNVAACEEAYRSFRATDCTYQPTRGPRRLCTKR